MKVQIDTESKTIKLLGENQSLGDIIEFLKKMFPDGEWKSYKLDSGIDFNINQYIQNPYPVIQPYIHHTAPFYEPPFAITCSGIKN